MQRVGGVEGYLVETLVLPVRGRGEWRGVEVGWSDGGMECSSPINCEVGWRGAGSGGELAPCHKGRASDVPCNQTGPCSAQGSCPRPGPSTSEPFKASPWYIPVPRTKPRMFCDLPTWWWVVGAVSNAQQQGCGQREKPTPVVLQPFNKSKKTRASLFFLLSMSQLSEKSQIHPTACSPTIWTTSAGLSSAARTTQTHNRMEKATFSRVCSASVRSIRVLHIAFDCLHFDHPPFVTSPACNSNIHSSTDGNAAPRPTTESKPLHLALLFIPRNPRDDAKRQGREALQ